MNQIKPEHTFHIPVLGTSFSLLTATKVAQFGISSVLSLVDDILIERVRRFVSEKEGYHYTEIRNTDRDARAHRITAFLNLVRDIVRKQIEYNCSLPFEPGNALVQYFEMLPEESRVKRLYRNIAKIQNSSKRLSLQQVLKKFVLPGAIDANIMTKLDRMNPFHQKEGDKIYSDALSALRGFANSDVNGSIVFSAGLNKSLYAYAASFDDFFPNNDGDYSKGIILKVSDYRSAEIQGAFLAKKGLWVQEYRIESSLNCGGHAFATKGLLLGPILEEFRKKRDGMMETLSGLYQKALTTMKKNMPRQMPSFRITVQGGIGTAEEDKFLREHYRLEGTGWGSPFLLCPDVTTIDESSLEKLVAATEQEVELSNHSPLGVPFWVLNHSASEEKRKERITAGVPGSSCPKGYLALTPISDGRFVCTATRQYQTQALSELNLKDLPPPEIDFLREEILGKTCICHDLAGCAEINFGLDEKATPAICCGPNIVFFKKISSLIEMVSHIYGRKSLFNDMKRPHMFIQELKIYIRYLKNELDKNLVCMMKKPMQYFYEFKENLLQGVQYYQVLATEFAFLRTSEFMEDLKLLTEQIQSIAIDYTPQGDL